MRAQAPETRAILDLTCIRMYLIPSFFRDSPACPPLPRRPQDVMQRLNLSFAPVISSLDALGVMNQVFPVLQAPAASPEASALDHTVSLGLCHPRAQGAEHRPPVVRPATQTGFHEDVDDLGR